MRRDVCCLYAAKTIERALALEGSDSKVPEAIQDNSATHGSSKYQFTNWPLCARETHYS
jgi:hypothetical protein